MTVKVILDFQEITRRFKQLQILDVDQVIGIAKGGVVPAALAAYQLEKPLSTLTINYRAEDNTPQREAPALLTPFQQPITNHGQHILLVDDVSVTGQTLDLALSLLAGFRITTLVLKGIADIVLFPEIDQCVLWPWKPSPVNQLESNQNT